VEDGRRLRYVGSRDLEIASREGGPSRLGRSRRRPRGDPQASEGRRLPDCERGIGSVEHLSPSCQRTRGRGERRSRLHHPLARGERMPAVGIYDTRSGRSGIPRRLRGRLVA
jgi:hypothetical protein